MRIDRKVLLAASLVLMVSFLGCGGGSSTSQSAPVITNLSYAPSQANQGPGGVTIFATVDAADIDDNMSTVTFTFYDSLGAMHTSTYPVSSGYLGDRFVDPSPPIEIAITGMDTTVAGNYPFDIYITDSTGLRSNVLTGTFRVI